MRAWISSFAFPLGLAFAVLATFAIVVALNASGSPKPHASAEQRRAVSRSEDPATPRPRQERNRDDEGRRGSEREPGMRGRQGRERSTAADDSRSLRRASAKEVFSHACGMCHTLRASGMSGMFGPDLDEVRPSAAHVRRMIRTGSIDGVMQPNLVQGEDARRVAAYVARVAGRHDR